MVEFSIIIGEVVAGNSSSAMDDILAELQDVLLDLDEKFSSERIASMKVTRRDQFLGGFTGPEVCFEVFSTIERAIFPNRVRGGIGVGRLSTPVKESITDMDGQCFHRARSAIEESRKGRSNLTLKSSYADKDEMMNTIFNLLGIIKDDWTDRQWEIASFYQSHEGITQMEIADEFDISQPAVAKILGRARVKKVEATNEVILNQLKDLVNHR